MHKPLSVALACSTLLGALVSCGTGLTPTVPTPSGDTVPVALTMTDDPPSGVSVLFFQVSLTGAALSPAAGTGPTVSLLPNNKPIQIDVTQLQALSAFLASASVPAGSYGSLSLTFSSPQLVIVNQSDTALSSSCAVGAMCTLTPAIDGSATVSLDSAPFPLTVSTGSPLGLLVDFHLNTIIQSDLTVDLAAANGISLSQVPAAAAGHAPPFGFVNGIVQSVSGTQFTLQTASGQSFTVDVNSSTTLIDWPPCASAGTLSCLTTGAAVQVQVAAVQSDGTLLAASVKWLQPANSQSVEGTVMGFSASQIRLLLHPGPTAAGTPPPPGAIATVNLDKGATFAVDANGFTIPSGLVFSSTDNLAPGQELQVSVDPGSLTCATATVVPGPPPACTFSTNSVQLEPSQISGAVSNISSPNFTLTYTYMPECGPNVCALVIALIQTTVQTTSQTTYEGFNPDSFSGLSSGDSVSVNGWIFENDNGLLDPAIAPPVILAQDIRMHPVVTP